MLTPDLPVTSQARPAEPLVEVRVNFGILAGREATRAELEQLGRILVPEFGEVSIVSEQRHELGRTGGAAAHQVRVGLSLAGLAPREERHAALKRLVDATERWVSACVAERGPAATDL